MPHFGLTGAVRDGPKLEDRPLIAGYDCSSSHPKEISDAWNGFWTDSHYNGTIEFSDEPF